MLRIIFMAIHKTIIKKTSKSTASAAAWLKSLVKNYVLPFCGVQKGLQRAVFLMKNY